MGFYYISLFSWIVFAIYFATVAAIVTKVCGACKLSKRWKVALLTLAFVAPWTEELWVAYNFGKLCQKDAGKFIYKTVEVEGYFDDTGLSGTAEIDKTGFQFVEVRDRVYRKIKRIERANDALRDQALAWYAKKNRGAERPKEDSIVYPINETEYIEVSPNGIDAWHFTKLDLPTARYHYLLDYGALLAHKVGRRMSRVIDSESGQELGHYTQYYREAYWFFIGLDAPIMICDGPDGSPAKQSILIDREILKPLRKP